MVSIAEKNVAERYEAIVESKIQKLRNLEKNPSEGFNANVISHNYRRQGASISVII